MWNKLKVLQPSYVGCTIHFCSCSVVLQEAELKFSHFSHVQSLPDLILVVQKYLQIHIAGLEGREV